MLLSCSGIQKWLKINQKPKLTYTYLAAQIHPHISRSVWTSTFISHSRHISNTQSIFSWTTTDFNRFFPSNALSIHMDESESQMNSIHFPLCKFVATIEMSTFVHVRHAFITHMRIATYHIRRSQIVFISRFVQHFGVYCVVTRKKGEPLTYLLSQHHW